MKQTTILLLCILIISCVSKKKESSTVFITNTGSKYHSNSCSYVEDKGVPISLEDAAQRYTPCEKCNPPVYVARPATADSAAAPSSNASSVKAKSVRCNAFTQKGKRCRRMTLNASGKCFQHDH